jgi:hypothetical protein
MKRTDVRRIIIAVIVVIVAAVVTDRQFFQPYRELRDARAVTSRPAQVGPGYLTIDELAAKLIAEERDAPATRPSTHPANE